MIEINLLPGASKKKAARGPAIDLAAVRARLTNIPDPFLLGVIAVCVVACAGTGWMYLSQRSAKTVADDRLDKAMTDSTHVSAVVVDRRRAEARLDTVLRQFNLIRTIDNDRYIWPHILDEVSRALPSLTWITSLAFSGTPQGTTNVAALPPAAAADTAKKGAKPKRLDTTIPKDPVSIRLIGRTADIEALTQFMRQLAASPFLRNVQLDQSQLEADQGQPITQFQLTMDYSRPDSTVLYRIPVGMSGR